MSEVLNQVWDIIKDYRRNMLDDSQAYELLHKLIYHQETRISSLEEALRLAVEALNKAYYLLSPNCPKEMNVMPTVTDIGEALIKIKELQGGK